MPNDNQKKKKKKKKKSKLHVWHVNCYYNEFCRCIECRYKGIWLSLTMRVQWNLITTTAFIPKDVAIETHLLNYRLLNEQNDT